MVRDSVKLSVECMFAEMWLCIGDDTKVELSIPQARELSELLFAAAEHAERYDPDAD